MSVNLPATQPHWPTTLKMFSCWLWACWRSQFDRLSFWLVLRSLCFRSPGTAPYIPAHSRRPTENLFSSKYSKMKSFTLQLSRTSLICHVHRNEFAVNWAAISRFVSMTSSSHISAHHLFEYNLCWTAGPRRISRWIRDRRLRFACCYRHVQNGSC